jgi:hypothetical protein
LVWSELGLQDANGCDLNFQQYGNEEHISKIDRHIARDCVIVITPFITSDSLSCISLTLLMKWRTFSLISLNLQYQLANQIRDVYVHIYKVSKYAN